MRHTDFMDFLWLAHLFMVGGFYNFASRDWKRGDELILIGKLDLRVVTVSCRNNK